MCEYAHGVFECWLHPARYRIRLCKDGTSCRRWVCFFAHKTEELQPLYVSTGSGIPSPQSSGSAADAVGMAAAMKLFCSSPFSVSIMSATPSARSMSPSANRVLQSPAAWPQPNVPTLHLPGINLQSSRLRSLLNARDIPLDDFNLLQDFEAQQQPLNNFKCLSQSITNSASLNRSGGSKTLTPSNLEELFSADISTSPGYSDHAVFSPSQKSAVLNQFQQQHKQSMLSPINRGMFSPKIIEHSLLQTPFGVPSPGRMSTRSVEPNSHRDARVSTFANSEKQHQQLRSLSSRDLGSNSAAAIVGSPMNSWTKWGSPIGKVDWSINGNELGRVHHSSSFELGNGGEDPNVPWVESIVKESPTAVNGTVPNSGGAGKNLNSNSKIDSIDHSVLGDWLEQMQLDQLAA